MCGPIVTLAVTVLVELMLAPLITASLLTVAVTALVEEIAAPIGLMRTTEAVTVLVDESVGLTCRILTTAAVRVLVALIPAGTIAFVVLPTVGCP
jgi:hypothetical protein